MIDSTNKAEIFTAIAHPLRIDILKILEKNPKSFSEIKRRFSIKSSGKLDHHLKKFNLLITTGNSGKYQLSDQGYAALESIRAIERIRFANLGFFIHILGYILVNLLIFLIWLGSSWGYIYGVPGFVSLLIGWGLGLLGYFFLGIYSRYRQSS